MKINDDEGRKVSVGLVVSVSEGGSELRSAREGVEW